MLSKLLTSVRKTLILLGYLMVVVFMIVVVFPE